jgi:eukaryotic-like serine/threonine-protein kinase
MTVIDRDRWRVLEPLLDRALDLSDDDRDAWLGELRSESPALAAELTALLSAEVVADRRGFLAEPLDVSLVDLQLGAYRLERPLGQGGMGTVWLARRTDGRFEGRAAVKLLNLALLSATGRERFRREGSLLARLAHPGIARLLDAGVAPSGQPYLVLEHIDGQRIDNFAEERALSREARIRLVLQVLAAVGHAHANLIVHRDLKPSNILVTHDGSVKLLDFGIAKLLDADDISAAAPLTIDGVRALTPDFAAPEQVHGAAITTATDVYALGVLLYILLSGRHPTAEGCRTPAEAIVAVHEVDPPRLGLRDLDTVLGKALRKAPAERYQTVAAFADDLERYLRDEPVSARRDSLGYRAQKFVRRNRVAVGAAAVVAAVLVGATVFSMAQMREARRQRDSAVRDSQRAKAMSELQSVLASDSRGRDGRALSPSERIALAEGVLTRQYRSVPWLVAGVMSDLSQRLYEIGDRVAQRSMLARARTIARDAKLPAEIALSNCLRVQSFAFDNLLDSARVDMAEANVALQQPGVRTDTTLHALCLDAEGQFLVAAGSPDSGIAQLERAVALVNADRDGTYRLTAINDLAAALRWNLRMREALPYQRQVIAELDSTGYGETEQLPNALTFLTTSLWELGELAAADSALKPFVRQLEAVHGSGQVSTVLAFQYGRGKLHLGELDSADVWIARAMTDTTQGAGWTQRWLPFLLTELRLEQGRLADAQRTSAQLPLPDTRGRRAAFALLRAAVRRETGDAAGASAFLEEELRAVWNDGGKRLTHFAMPFVTAGEWRLAAGDARAADSLAQLGLRAAVVDSLAASRSAFAGRAELLRARARLALGDRRAAREAVERAVVALANGYGGAHRSVGEARGLLETLSR